MNEEVEVDLRALADISIASLERDIIDEEGFHAFVVAAWDHVDTNPHVIEKHEVEICKHLEAVYYDVIYNLLINIPPGLAKSLLANVFWPAWVWTKNPAYRMGFVSNDIALVRRDARKCRALVESEWYQERWPIKLVGDANRIDAFENTKGGVRASYTLGKQLTGFHFHSITVDDPHKAQTLTEVELLSTKVWFNEVLPTRWVDQDAGKTVIIMQRLHEDDLSGHVIENHEEFEHLCLPMEFEVDKACKTSVGGDWRTKERELLAPLRRPRTAVENLKKRFNNARISSAQLQQDPIPSGGTIFYSDWFDKRYAPNALPDNMQIYHSWDANMGAKTKAGSYCVGTVWGASDGDFYLLDLVRGRYEFMDTVKHIVRLLDRYPTHAALLVEAKAAGSSIISALEHEKVKRIVPINPGRQSKEDRAYACVPLFEAGSVYFPENATYMNDLLKEMLSFPAGRYDDITDSVTQGLNFMSGNSAARTISAFKNIKRFFL